MDRNSYDSGDWFNRVDFTQASNNWHVGLPLAEDNQDDWDAIGEVITNSETAVQAHHIALAGEVFKELLTIRNASRLFRLTTAQDIYERVGFHNTGNSQTKGLIVMSLDDGTGLDDLDPNNDAIVVVINGTTDEQAYAVPTATGFELHSVQQNSADGVVQMASFTVGASDGTFTVPALTTAVFVKPQSTAQGLGLAAGVTRDAPDIAPFGSNTLYLSGSMNNSGNDGFSAADTFVYQGNGIYRLDTSLLVGAQTFAITSIDALAVDLGFSDISVTNSAVTLTDSSDNLTFTVATSGNYTFTLDASNVMPSLTVSSVSPTVDCSALTDSADAIPFTIAGDGELYVRGDHSGWGADDAYRLHYKGNNVYQVVADFDGVMQFKLASNDDSWTTQLWAQADGSTDINSSDLTVGVSYPVAYNNAGTDNNKATLAAGSYSFLLTLDEANPAQAANIGSLIIQQCQP